MEELSAEEAERLRRSLAMLPADGPSWMSAGRVRAILDQLVRLLRDRRGRPDG